MAVSSSTPGYLFISYLSVRLVRWRDTWLPVHLIPECEVHLIPECEVGTLVGHLVTCPSCTECEVAGRLPHLCIPSVAPRLSPALAPAESAAVAAG